MTMDATQELAALLWANVPLVNVVTYEEDRIVRILEAIEGTETLGIVRWDLADGFQVLR